MSAGGPLTFGLLRDVADQALTNWKARVQWRIDARARICAGSGLPVLRPGHAFGKCSSCLQTLVAHDGDWPHPRAERHQEPSDGGLDGYRLWT